MTTSSYTQTLIDKLSELPREKLAEVEDFIDFLRDKQRRMTPEQRLRSAAKAGLITTPARGKRRSSATDLPPVAVPGTPASEIVLQDRR